MDVLLASFLSQNSLAPQVVIPEQIQTAKRAPLRQVRHFIIQKSDNRRNLCGLLSESSDEEKLIFPSVVNPAMLVVDSVSTLTSSL